MVDLSIVFLLTFTRPGKSNLETKDAALQFIWNSPSPGAAYWAPISTCPSSLALARKEIWQTRQLWQYFIASPYIYNIYIYIHFFCWSDCQILAIAFSEKFPWQRLSPKRTSILPTSRGHPNQKLQWSCFAPDLCRCFCPLIWMPCCIVLRITEVLIQI
jgi:hypothetical protein